jgi:GYF domain 2
MEWTYTVRGRDGKEYGPVNLAQLGGWAREGRLHPQVEVKRSDMDYWVPAGDFSELQPLFGTTVATARPGATAAAAPVAKVSPATTAQLKSGASWFYWIAALSLVNSIAALTGTGWRFLLGLGITQIIDAFGTRLGGSAKAVVLVLDLAVAGVFVLFGVFASKAHIRAFIVGMTLFGLDGLLMVLLQDWWGVGFHVFALYCLFRGLSACREVRSGKAGLRPGA